MDSARLSGFVLSLVRDFAAAEKILRDAATLDLARERILGRTPLSPAAVAAVARAAEQEERTFRPETVKRCLESLGGRVRSLLRFRYRDGRGVAWISRRTKATPSAVQRDLCRARGALARCGREAGA
jgi:DNA-directed RNA polymerase specialized sigma24 family protein